MTAVREACLTGNIIQVVVGEEQEIFSFVEPYGLYILLAALTVFCMKLLGKVGIAHVGKVSKI